MRAYDALKSMVFTAGMMLAIIPGAIVAGENLASIQVMFQLHDMPTFRFTPSDEVVTSAVPPRVDSGTPAQGEESVFFFASSNGHWDITMSGSGAYTVHYGNRMIFNCEPGDAFCPLIVSEEDLCLYAISDVFDEYATLIKIAPDGRAERIHAECNIRSDVTSIVMYGETKQKFAAISHFSERMEYCFFSAALEELHKRANSLFPDADIFWIEGDSAGRRWLCKVVRYDQPESWCLFTTGEKEVEILYQAKRIANTAKGRLITYGTRDNKTASGYVTLPRNGSPPYPLIVFIHGGPSERVYPWFDARVQVFAREGYAVFQPNYRGSRGLGKQWMRGGWREWGTGVAQHDITDGVRHLIDTGIADRERVVAFGGSFGGYGALSALAFTPDLYACGVSFFGPSDLLRFVRDYSGPLAGMDVPIFGDVHNPDDANRLIQQSPLHAAVGIQKPLFLYHGVNDIVVPIVHSDVLAELLSRSNVPHVYHRSPEAGHGFTSLEHEAEIFHHVLKFISDNTSTSH